MEDHHSCRPGHSHADGGNRLGIALGITAFYMIAEAVGGVVFNSLALLADAGHMLSDVMALGLSWVAIRIGRRSPNDRLTFGFKRTEILASLFNGVALWAIVAVIFYEAAHRFLTPRPVAGTGMLLIAALGLLVNLAVAAVLFRSREESLNIRGAFLHVVADALGSVGAIIAAVAIIFTGRFWVDPLVSVFIGILVLYSSWGLVRESVHILMEGVPAHLDVRKIEEAMVAQAGVCCVYDLHVWTISSDRSALSAHVVMSDADQDRQTILAGLQRLLAGRFSIDHSTIQLETTHDMRPQGSPVLCREGTVCQQYPATNETAGTPAIDRNHEC
ncbi:MAG: cation diffusion facilitator family transporter [Thermodesulfobacteriota bacterium]